MNNSTALIAGALTGIGRARALAFAREGAMRLKVAKSPTMDLLGEGKIESVAEAGAGLNLVGEDGSTATLRLAKPGSSVTVQDESGQVEYAG
jgi:NAD(P)-dependent dehydrogenase (short-subunit alcohol dehydrogenase family)